MLFFFKLLLNLLFGSVFLNLKCLSEELLVRSLDSIIIPILRSLVILIDLGSKSAFLLLKLHLLLKAQYWLFLGSACWLGEPFRKWLASEMLLLASLKLL